MWVLLLPTDQSDHYTLETNRSTCCTYCSSLRLSMDQQFGKQIFQLSSTPQVTWSGWETLEESIWPHQTSGSESTFCKVLASSAAFTDHYFKGFSHSTALDKLLRRLLYSVLYLEQLMFLCFVLCTERPKAVSKRMCLKAQNSRMFHFV